jgi:hypothetical protein
MTNALFGFRNNALTGAFTASAAVAALGPDQMANPHGATSTSWQTPAGTTTAWARLNAGAAVEWGAVALCNTNLTPAATVRWRLSDDATFAASPVWDTGAVPVVAAGYRQAVAVEPAALQAAGPVNTVVNPRGAGLVAGSPGTLPTGWAQPASQTGLTRTLSVEAAGAVNGIGWRLAGTASSTASSALEPAARASAPAALPSQSRSVTCLLWIAGGTLTNIDFVRLASIALDDAGEVVLTQTGEDIKASLTATPQIFTYSYTTPSTTTVARVNPRLTVRTVNGTASDLTLGIAYLSEFNTPIPPSVVTLPPALARYLRVDIADPGNPAGFLRAAQLYAGPVARPIGNIGYETAFARTVDAPALTTRGGQEFPILRHTRRGWRIALPSLREAEVWPLVDALQLAAADGRNVLFIPFPAGADIQRDAVFGRMTEPAPITWPNATPLRRAWSCTITERL